MTGLNALIVTLTAIRTFALLEPCEESYASALRAVFLVLPALLFLRLNSLFCEGSLVLAISNLPISLKDSFNET